MNPRLMLLTIGLLGGFALPGCAKSEQPAKKIAMNIHISSTAFSEGEPIPEKYTCQGRDISPPLRWTNAPPDTQSYVLFAEDPDAPAGTWIHWVVYDLPPSTTELAEDTPKSQYLPGGAKQGINDFHKLGFGGPCPPSGKPHRYFFKVFALDTTLDLKPGATKAEVEQAMKNRILAEGQLMGTYQRK